MGDNWIGRLDSAVGRTACRCGSGQSKHPLNDANGIFCTYVCDSCEPRRRAEFNPAIFSRATYPQDEQIEEN